MKYPFLAFIPLFLFGCAGSAPDIDFRTKVQSVSGDLKATPVLNSQGEVIGAGGEADVTVIFRDPSARTADLSKEMQLPKK